MNIEAVYEAARADLRDIPRDRQLAKWEARQAWSDRNLYPLLSRFTVAVCLWAATGFRWWYVSPVIAVVVHGLGAMLALPATSKSAAEAWMWRARRMSGRLWIAVACIGVFITPIAWLRLPLSLALIAVLTAATATLRARRRLTLRVLQEASNATGSEPGELTMTSQEWSGRHMTAAQMRYSATWSASVQARRDALGHAVRWHLQADAANTELEYKIKFTPAARSVAIFQAPTLPRLFLDREWPDSLDGVVLGVTDMETADAVVDGIPVSLWEPDTHLLIAGVTQNGKTNLTRGLVVRGLKTGRYPGGCRMIDGKMGGDFLSLRGREGVIGVANLREEWEPALRAELDVMYERYAATSAWQEGRGPKPDLPRRLLVIDEIQQVNQEMPKGLVNEVARLALASKTTLVAATQRPDAGDAIPGAARDQISDRIIVGTMSEDGGRMMLGEQWREATAIPAIKGRLLVRKDGRFQRVQTPYLPSPVDDPSVEHLYPERPTQKLAPQPVQRSEDTGTARVIDLTQKSRENAVQRPPEPGAPTGPDEDTGTRRRRGRETD